MTEPEESTGGEQRLQIGDVFEYDANSDDDPYQGLPPSEIPTETHRVDYVKDGGQFETQRLDEDSETTYSWPPVNVEENDRIELVDDSGAMKMPEGKGGEEYGTQAIREEDQKILTAYRNGDEVLLHIAEYDPIELTVAEYGELLTQIRRTKWLIRDEEQLESEEKVDEIDGEYVGEGHCHECGFEGYIVENEIGTTYCPKCRSTNVGWPVT